MKQRMWDQKACVLVISLLFCSTILLPLSGATFQEEYPLPPPQNVDMALEQAIFRRMSVREFTNQTVTDEELSTVLWAACGYQTDGGRTIAGINNTYSGIIYVLKEDAAYTYDPLNHSLVFFKEGDWRDIVGWQYKAPIQLGLCYDKNKADAKIGGAELGQIGQNIQFMANALGLGTVVCGQTPPAIKPLGIPSNQEGIIVMPLGHMSSPYNFKNRPFWFSTYPRIRTSLLSLSEALDQRAEESSFSGSLTRKEVGQFIWASYGFSPYIDRSGQEKNAIKRHRTVPSAHGYYPLRMYAVTQKGIYYYQPNFLAQLGKFPIDSLGLPVLTFLSQKIAGDHRQEISMASENPAIASAPLLILMMLDLNKTRPEGYDDFSAEIFRRLWYYEAGASTHNILMEATAWGLSANIVVPKDISALQSILSVNDYFIPLFIVPLGR